jgi:hypothetical protein
MPGNPDSPNPSQQGPYFVQQRNGVTLDKNGNAVPPNSAEAHIPEAEYEFNQDLFVDF